MQSPTCPISDTEVGGTSQIDLEFMDGVVARDFSWNMVIILSW